MTIVEICNMALGFIAVEAITALTDATVRAQLVNASYATVRDAILEERDWQFASSWSKAPVDSTAPISPDYSYRVARPTGTLAVRQVVDGDGQPIEWQLDGEYVLVESTVDDLTTVDGVATDGVYLRVTQQITDPTKWPSTFIAAFAHRLASVLAAPLAENRSAEADQWGLYERALAKAASSDSMQGRPFQGPTVSYLKNARSS